MAITQDDCRGCGACCCNPPANRDEDYVDYIQVERDDAILRRPDLTSRHVLENEAGELHLRLDTEGRCQALSGKVGGRNRCRIYHWRPAACRRVEPGGQLCLSYRRQHGVE